MVLGGSCFVGPLLLKAFCGGRFWGAFVLN